MKKEFLIDQSISLKGESFYYDLHNCYDFSGVNIIRNFEENLLKMYFKKISEHWVKETDPQIIIISFEDIKLLKFSEGFFINFSKNIEEIGYKEPSNEDYNYFMDEKQSDRMSHLVFRFDNNEFLRVYATKVKVD